MFTEKAFIAAVEESFRMYKQYGARSTEKLKPIHQYIANVLKSVWGSDYEVHFMGNSSRELTVEGRYYPKDIDITVTQSGKPIFCLGIKFVTSNYKQNANNYFESMMGETANIQALKYLPYAHLIVLRQPTPYYKRQVAGKPREVAKWEIISDKDMKKYLTLAFENQQAHRPYAIGIMVINVDEQTGTITPENLEKSFSEQTVKLLRDKLSLTTFFKEIENYKNYLLSK